MIKERINRWLFENSIGLVQVLLVLLAVLKLERRRIVVKQ